MKQFTTYDIWVHGSKFKAENLRYRENKYIAQSQTASKWQSQIQLQTYLIPEHLSLPQSYTERAKI